MAQKTLTEEQVKAKFQEFQILQKHIEHLSEQAEAMSQQHMELEISKAAVQEIGNATVNQELLAPVANGIFIKGELKDTQKLVVNVGSDVTVERTVDEVVVLLEEQERKIMAKMGEAQEILEQLQAQAMALFEQIKDYVSDDE